VNSRISAPARHPFLLTIATLTLVACGGGGLSGEYTPPDGGGGFFEKLAFTSGKKVQITFMGQTRELTYQVDGKTLKIISPNASETQIFTMDNAGCIDGGGMIGRYCRSGGAAASGSGRELAGTWEAKAPGGSFRLTFAGGNKVQMTMQDDGGSPETHDGSYTVSGNTVTISSPGGMPIQLTRKGGSLEATMGGLTMTFTQR
jgi:hypothetical protein